MVRELKLLARLGVGNKELVDPDSLIIHVADPAGRIYDANTNSITSASVGSWQTARRDEKNLIKHPGFRAFLSRKGFSANIAKWSNLRVTLAVNKGNKEEAAGATRLWCDSNSTNTFVTPTLDGAEKSSPYSLSSVSETDTDLFFELETLDTPLFECTYVATHNEVNDYDATGTYTFRFGPMAELEVQDGGKSPLVGESEPAYTTVARLVIGRSIPRSR